MKPPMGNMYSFCSRFARAIEVIDIKSLSLLRSNNVPEDFRNTARLLGEDRMSAKRQMSIRRNRSPETGE